MRKIEIKNNSAAIIFSKNKIILDLSSEKDYLKMSQPDALCYTIAKLFEDQDTEFFELLERKSHELSNIDNEGLN